MITGNLHYGMTWEEYRLSMLVKAMGRKLLKEQGVDEGEPLKAYINRGRWIIQCECGGAEYAWDDGLFMCQSCFNSNNGHKYRKFVFPRNRVRIEKLLLVRPLTNRNWFANEPISNLEAENVEHAAELIGGA